MGKITGMRGGKPPAPPGTLPTQPDGIWTTRMRLRRYGLADNSAYGKSERFRGLLAVPHVQSAVSLHGSGQHFRNIGAEVELTA